MRKGHGASRRQAYGRRMKDLRTRRSTDLEVDLEGPDTWNRGDAWDGERITYRPSPRDDRGGAGARSS